MVRRILLEGNTVGLWTEEGEEEGEATLSTDNGDAYK